MRVIGCDIALLVIAFEFHGIVKAPMCFWMPFGMVTSMETKQIRSSKVLVDYWHIL